MDEHFLYSVEKPEERAHDVDIGEDSRPAVVSDERLRAPVQAYIENARDDSIGGFTIPLPTTKEVLQPWLDALGAGGFHEADIAIREVRSPIMELGNTLRGFSAGELAFDELNYLAVKVSGMKNWQAELFVAAVEAGQHCGSLRDLINLAENVNLFDLQPAFSEQQYGEFQIQMEKDNTAEVFEKLEQSSNPEERAFAQYVLRLEAYADEKAYGRGVAQEEGGVFTSRGYLAVRGELKEVYRGHEDIPLEHRIFTGPPPPMMSVDAPLDAGDCVPGGMDADLKGRVVALREEALRPEYRTASHQLMLATGGFGCSPGSRGRAVFATNLYSGEQERWSREDILGVVAETTLPAWAYEKLERLREPREKESVLAKIREAKSSPSPAKEEPRQKKSHEPEI